MKTVNTLIEELQALVKQDENLGEVPLYVIADHGQTFIEAGKATVEYTDAYPYYAEVIYEEDFVDIPSNRLLKFVCVGD